MQNRCLLPRMYSRLPATAGVEETGSPSLLRASAVSSGLLCERLMGFAVVVIVDTLLDLRGAQLAGGLDDGALAVQPLRLDRVQPRRLDWQAAHTDLAAALTFDLAVVLTDP